MANTESNKPFTDWKPYLVPKKYKDNYDRIFKKGKKKWKLKQSKSVA